MGWFDHWLEDYDPYEDKYNKDKNDDYVSHTFDHWLRDLKDFEPMHNTNWEVKFETPPKAIWVDKKKEINKENIKKYLNHLYGKDRDTK